MRALALAALVFVGCHRDPVEPGFSSGLVVTSVSSSTSTGSTGSTGSPESTSTPESSSTSSTSSTSSSGIPDLPTPPDFGPDQPEGCKGKIDFLFAISRFGTMQNEQAALLASFEGFMTTIQEEFADFDAHVLVANLDGGYSPNACESQRCPNYYPNCGPNAEGYMCNPPYESTYCDGEMGAGILFNAGPYATNHPCVLAGGRRYIVVKEEPDLTAQFKCIASVGTFGADTPMMKGIAATVAPELNADGGCNEGFLRPDALLVIVMVMDEVDDHSFGKPAEWADKVIAAKGGDPDAIVMVAIIAPLPEDPPKPTCAYDDGFPPLKLREYAERFPHRVIGDVCADTFAPALAQAATVVKETCGAFIPQ